jgi:hypothetical protein
MVLGVNHGKEVFAYPIDRLAEDRLRRCKIDGEAAVLLWFGPTRTAAAYLSTASPPQKGGRPRAVTLSRDDRFQDAPFIDKETGSHWDITGRAVAGELKGWTLTWIDSTQVKWYAWAAEYPKAPVLIQPPQDP